MEALRRFSEAGDQHARIDKARAISKRYRWISDTCYSPVDLYQGLQRFKGPGKLPCSGRVCDIYVPLSVMMFVAFAHNIEFRGCMTEGQQIQRLMAYRRRQVNGHGGHAGLVVSRLCKVYFKVNLTSYARSSSQFTCKEPFRKDIHVEECVFGFASLASSCRALWAACQTNVERTSHAF